MRVKRRQIVLHPMKSLLHDWSAVLPAVLEFAAGDHQPGQG